MGVVTFDAIHYASIYYNHINCKALPALQDIV